MVLGTQKSIPLYDYRGYVSVVTAKCLVNPDEHKPLFQNFCPKENEARLT